jgi:D-glycerate 3-kinase
MSTPSTTLDTTIHRALSTLLPAIKHQHHQTSHPLILGISGLQGSGKSTWAAKIVDILSSQHALHAITISLDDLYKTHDDLIAQRDKDPKNKLYRTRGQPGTHDEGLAERWFGRVRDWRNDGDADGELRIPQFDKSRFGGEGDRAPKVEWPLITRKPDVVVFEGWCVGFQPLSASAIEAKYKLAQAGKLPLNTPAHHSLAHLLEINESLRRYCDAFMGPRHFDSFIHIDTDDLSNVYTWRLQQEHKLIEARGEGMSDERVRAFIDGYMPSYEMYLEGLREGLFGEGQSGRMVRVELNREREVVGVVKL